MVIEPVPHCDWMIPAVLTCLCCFWPTGICAIISASKVVTSSVYVCLTKVNNNPQRGIAINFTNFSYFSSDSNPFRNMNTFLYLKANAAAARGDVTETHRLSSKARSLVIASFALGIIITGIVVTYRLLLARRYYQWVLIETVMDLHLFKTMWNTFIYDNLHGSVMNIFKLRIRYSLHTVCFVVILLTLTLILQQQQNVHW